MYILRIEHPVPDYDAWKVAFGSDPIGRERSDVRRYRILRPTDDPNYVTVDLEFDSAGGAVRAALDDPTRRRQYLREDDMDQLPNSLRSA
jgi:hypothetical protein